MSAWLSDRPDRTDLVQWLAVRNGYTSSEFYRALLADLIAHGALSAVQERALRRARDRVMRAERRAEPSRGGRPDGKRRGAAEYRGAGA
jgi:hypothetical protein